MIITSSSNEKIKQVKKMKEDKEYLFLDGPHLVGEAIKAGRRLDLVVVEEGKEEKYSNFLNDSNEIIVVSRSVFERLSTTIYSQGIIAIVKNIVNKFALPKGNYLVLDEVQDPGNVGTLIRSALAAGFLDVYLLNCASISNDKVVRSTMGTIFNTRLYELSREKFLELYKSFPKSTLYTADMVGENVFKSQFEKPCGVVVGNEGKGVSQELRTLCDKMLSIPMENGLESLNAGVAGSVIMLQIANKQ